MIERQIDLFAFDHFLVEEKLAALIFLVRLPILQSVTSYGPTTGKPSKPQSNQSIRTNRKSEINKKKKDAMNSFNVAGIVFAFGKKE